MKKTTPLTREDLLAIRAGLLAAYKANDVAYFDRDQTPEQAKELYELGEVLRSLKGRLLKLSKTI